MNYTRQQFACARGVDKATEKRYYSWTKKNRAVKESEKFDKENDSDLANRNLNIYDYRNAVISEDETSPTDSQNYVLRLSEDSLSPLDLKKTSHFYKINESKRKQMNNQNATVSISDSANTSSGDNSPGFNTGKKKPLRIRPTPFYPNPSVPMIVIESSDSDDDGLFRTDEKLTGMINLDSDDDSVLNTLKNRKEDPFARLKKSADRSGSFDTLSFDSEQSSARGKKSDDNKRGERISGKIQSADSSGASSSTHFSPGSDLVEDSGGFGKQKIISESSSNDEGILTSTKKNYGSRSRLNPSGRSKQRSLSSNDSFGVKKHNFQNITARSNSKCQISTKPFDFTIKLTKKDAEGIFKGVKVGGNSHWTPKFGPSNSQPDSEPLSNYSQPLKNPRIINETPSEIVMSDSNSEDEIISNSSGDLKPAKTHITRFINPPNQEQQYANLSDRKKNEISHWLMNNSPGSSSSSSIVSESNRNSSFGNSSLERFELKHETPNNRGKISRPSTTEKTSSVPRGIERYIYKGKTGVLKNQTPLGARPTTERTKPNANEVTPINDARKPERKENLPVVKTVENLHIEDCADILDKLYGNVWRNKADAVLTPKTEPKNKKNSIINNKGQSKTERKNTSKPPPGNRRSCSSSEEDDFDAFAKDIRPNFNSTKKKAPRDSFIDDKSPSENSSESFYHTALTNPRESRDNQRLLKPTPVSVSTRRAVAICDSDSDSEENYPRISDKDANKKRLSFSEDASDSSTSEFDPGEVVLPKPKAKKAPAKSFRQTSKTNAVQGTSKLNSSDNRCRSFLTSLSATVPIQNCHPQARVYRDNYKNKKEELSRYLFQLYNKEIFEGKLPSDMPIEWNVRMRGTAGFCYNRKSVKALGGIVRSSRIVLATKILDTPDRLRDTLVHEMCHAAAWLINNVSDGHGPFWKGWASKAVKVFPELPPIKRCHDYKIKTKFTYRCTKCGYSIGRHSKSLNIESKRCGHCYGKFELLVNRTTRSGTMQVATPVQARTPSGFALFVKENYHSVKKDRRSIKHGEVMKILGQQFSAVKIAKKSNSSGDIRT